MSTIAAHLQYISDELRMTTDILIARENCRKLEAAIADTKPGPYRHVANIKHANALATVLRLEKQYRDTFGPADITPEYDRAELKTDETFAPRIPRMTADERADDPRRGQGDRRYAK